MARFKKAKTGTAFRHENRPLPRELVAKIERTGGTIGDLETAQGRLHQHPDSRALPTSGQTQAIYHTLKAEEAGRRQAYDPFWGSLPYF